MVCSLPIRRWLLLAGAVAPLALADPATADEIKGAGQFKAEDETVELFEGLGSGQLEARLIVKDSTRCRLFIMNKSDRPLNVAMPSALAGAPVLGQFIGGPNAPNQLNQNNNAPQAVGVGNQIGANPNNNAAGPNVFNLGAGRNNNANVFAPFNIAPEKVGTLKLTAVCLEHGKPEPRAKMDYELRPIESVTAKPEVAELCATLGRGEVSQRAAQAAAWHLNNGMSWQELKAKRLKLALGAYSRPFFSPQELSAAAEAAEKAMETAREKAGSGQSGSLAQR